MDSTLIIIFRSFVCLRYIISVPYIGRLFVLVRITHGTDDIIAVFLQKLGLVIGLSEKPLYEIAEYIAEPFVDGTVIILVNIQCHSGGRQGMSELMCQSIIAFSVSADAASASSA